MENKDVEARVWIQISEPGLPVRSASLDIKSASQLASQLGFPVSDEMLADSGFREKHAVSLASNIKDNQGTTVYELDVIAVGDPRDWRSYHLLRHGWCGPEQPFTLHRAGEVINWSSGAAARCTRIGNYHENAEAYRNLIFTHFR
ncbi:hypothetical protein [Hymenobacter arizonensis]|nr:hypothetical protein [Hymenobacter arizonensis]